MEQPADQPTAESTHRRETLRYITLPMLGGGVVMLIPVILVLLIRERLPVSLIADWMLAVCVLCPLALCLFPVTIAMMVMAFGMNKVHDGLARPLRRAGVFSKSIVDRAARLTDSINRRSISLSTVLAPLNTLWGIFDRPQEKPELTGDSSHDHHQTGR